tara:strand:- start:706 stop:1269 length:564 start_codon:yes stop_codon:yes gene_type:complete
MKTLEVNQLSPESINSDDTEHFDPPEKSRLRAGWLTLAIVGIAGFSIGLVASYWPAESTHYQVNGAISSMLPSLMAQTTTDLGDGKYAFLANRRTIWAINKDKGRFAGYHFREDEDHTVERTRVTTLDPKIFPPADTIYMLSDRNLTEALWICNKRSGDVQLWTPRIGGEVKAEKPLSTSQDLEPSK